MSPGECRKMNLLNDVVNTTKYCLVPSLLRLQDIPVCRFWESRDRKFESELAENHSNISKSENIFLAAETRLLSRQKSYKQGRCTCCYEHILLKWTIHYKVTATTYNVKVGKNYLPQCQGSCVCLQVLFKLDKTGEGQEICIEDLGYNKGLSFVGFTPQMFLEVVSSVIFGLFLHRLYYCCSCKLSMLF